MQNEPADVVKVLQFKFLLKWKYLKKLLKAIINMDFIPQ